MEIVGPGGCAKPKSKRAAVLAPRLEVTLPEVVVPRLEVTPPIQSPIPPTLEEIVRQTVDSDMVTELVADCPLLLKSECPHGVGVKKSGGC